MRYSNFITLQISHWDLLINSLSERHSPYSAYARILKGINLGSASTDHLYFHIASLL